MYGNKGWEIAVALVLPPLPTAKDWLQALGVLSKNSKAFRKGLNSSRHVRATHT
jgi:hypothetical protein